MRIIFLIVLLDLFGFGVIIPLLPFYVRAYIPNATFQVGLIMALYSVFQLVASPVLGLLSDRFGRRPILVFSQIGSAAGYLLLAAATFRPLSNPLLGLFLICASRVIDGISGGNISTAQAYVGDVVGTRNRSAAMGKLGAAFGIGFALGPTIGGLLGRINVGLPALFAALLSGAAAAGSFFYLPESLPASARNQPQEVDSPLFHPSRYAPVTNDRPLLQLLLIFFISMFAFVMMEATFAMFIQDRLQLATKSAVLLAGIFLGFAGIVICVMQGALIGRLTRRFGEGVLAITGPLLIVLAMSLYVAVGASPGRDLPLLIAILCFAGLFNATGRSLQTPTLSALVSHRAEILSKQRGRSFQGIAFGLFHMLGSLARATGPIIATAIYTPMRTWPPFALAGMIMACAGLWTMTLLARRREEIMPAVAV
jgi:DHA1 family tetracycline resistance protein-like MFS transporter